MHPTASPSPRPSLVPLALAAFLGFARAESVATPKFSLERGLHSAPATLALRTKTPGAVIRFTTDGTLPTGASGRLYQTPLALTATTVVRARAFRDGLDPSDTGTRTFLFPASTLRQTGSNLPPTWGVREGWVVPADYAMDARAAATEADRRALEESLRALPSLSLALDPEDLFGAGRGLYTHPQETGEAWERPASVEFLPVDGREGFQRGVGLRIQGGWNRRPEESPKHSLRLVFRKRYGDGRLKYPLFGEGPDTFETLILRGGNNHSWLHWSGAERRTADYARDPWMRESYAALGQVSARSRFVHLYLNGLYWGVYNLAERPDEHFAAARFGGPPESWDARNADKILSGDSDAWDRMFTTANAGLADPERFAAVSRWLDLPAFADYMLLNLYGANGDWDRSSNWYAARPRTPEGRFRFFVWDAERTLENTTDNRLQDDDDQSPTRLFQKLRENPAFRTLFAARARQHLLGAGALTPAPAQSRYAALSRILEPAILAEAARWGDYRSEVHRYKEGPYERYSRDDHWRPEVHRLLTDYFPHRTAQFLNQLRAAGLADPE